jgi:hypothetical protein
MTKDSELKVANICGIESALNFIVNAVIIFTVVPRYCI